MQLILVRHADALPKDVDPERPLSEAGRDQAERTADAAWRLGLSPEAIVHSGKARARQTAEILAAALTPPGGLVEQKDALAPKADPQLAADLAGAAEGTLLLVGHLPHLARLVSLLLTGDADRETVSLAAAALVHLERAGDAWRLRALIPPLGSDA
jgi:phosphohistidine phosphatase